MSDRHRFSNATWTVRIELTPATPAELSKLALGRAFQSRYGLVEGQAVRFLSHDRSVRRTLVHEEASGYLLYPPVNNYAVLTGFQWLPYRSFPSRIMKQSVHDFAIDIRTFLALADDLTPVVHCGDKFVDRSEAVATAVGFDITTASDQKSITQELLGNESGFNFWPYRLNHNSQLAARLRANLSRKGIFLRYNNFYSVPASLEVDVPILRDLSIIDHILI